MTKLDKAREIIAKGGEFKTITFKTQFNTIDCKTVLTDSDGKVVKGIGEVTINNLKIEIRHNPSIRLKRTLEDAIYDFFDDMAEKADRRKRKRAIARLRNRYIAKLDAICA